MRKVTCRCEQVFDADLPNEIDLDAEPGRIEEILAGTFFSVTCPRCGAMLKPELPVRLRSLKRKADISILPEIDRFAFYLGKIAVPAGGEVLIGYPELYERAKIYADDLDPVAVEIVKYYLAAKAEEEAGENEDVFVTYAGAKEKKLLFHVTGLKEGELAVIPVGRDYYERTLADKRRTLQSEPFTQMFEGPYKSLRSLEAGPDA